MSDDMLEKWVEARSSAYTILDSEFRRMMHQGGAKQVLPGDVKVGDVVATLRRPPQKVTAVRDPAIYVGDSDRIDAHTEATFRMSREVDPEEVKPGDVAVIRDEGGEVYLGCLSQDDEWSVIRKGYATYLLGETVTVIHHVGSFEDVVSREDAGMAVTEDDLRGQETRAAVDQYCDTWWVEGGRLYYMEPGSGVEVRSTVFDDRTLRWVYPKSQH